MAGDEPISKEEKLKNRYLKASKFLFLITMIYALWIAITILGAYFLKLGSRWAVFSIEQWILSGIIFISISFRKKNASSQNRKKTSIYKERKSTATRCQRMRKEEFSARHSSSSMKKTC
jgi:hypothetical protein